MEFSHVPWSFCLLLQDRTQKYVDFPSGIVYNSTIEKEKTEGFEMTETLSSEYISAENLFRKGLSLFYEENAAEAAEYFRQAAEQ